MLSHKDGNVTDVLVWAGCIFKKEKKKECYRDLTHLTLWGLGYNWTFLTTLSKNF